MHVKKVALLAAGTLVLVGIVFFGPLRFVDNLFYDLNFAFSAVPASDSVVVVAVDVKSISDRGAWPWNRSTLAGLVEQIESARPGAIALDFLFPHRDGEQENDSLAAVFSRVSNLVLPFRAAGITTSANRGMVLVPSEVYNQRFFRLANQKQLNSHLFYSATRFEASDSQFVTHTVRGGFLNVSTSNTSQKLREIIHVIRSGSEYFPSFGLSAVAAYYGLRPTQFALDGNGPTVIMGEHRLPLTSYAGTTFLNYRNQNHPIVTVSASDVLNGTFDRSLLAGKLVFVGITDPAAGAADFFITPVRSQFPGVEAWATAALDILEHSWVRRGGGVEGIVNWVLVLVLFPGLALAVPYRHKIFSLAGGLLMVAASVGAGVILFRTQHYFWNPANHLYAWFFGLLWLAAQKADPTLAQPQQLEIEPPTDDGTDSLAAPSPGEFLETVPQTATGVHVLNLLTAVHPTGAAQPLPTAQTVNGTLVEQSLSTIADSVQSSAAPTGAPVAGEPLEEFRRMAGGQIVRLLGSGGMADVYLVWNPRLELYRAVKVLKPQQTESSNTRFETEIRIFAKLNHPNIVQCYTVGDWHSLPYVEMEYVNGASLESMVEKCGALDPAAAMGVGILVCRALAYAHTQVITIYGKTYRGLIHRDIKPANILMSRSGRIKLTDFGIARPTEVSLHTADTGNVVGTLPYLAPEQLDGDDISNKADLYALGATLYELVSGRRAFAQGDVSALVKAKAMGTLTPLTPSDKLPARFTGLIARAMATNPLDRFESAKAMGNELEGCMREVLNGTGYACLRELANRFWG